MRARERAGQKEVPITAAAVNRINVYGPKVDGTYLVEFRAAAAGHWRISIAKTVVPTWTERTRKLYRTRDELSIIRNAGTRGSVI
jgi:hypothetical protein